MSVRRRSGPRRVRELMSKRVVSTTPRDTLTAVARLMRDERVGATALIERGHLVGIITERDLMRAIAEGHDPRTAVAADHMTATPMTVRPDDRASDAAALMIAIHSRHLPVVEDGVPVGFLSARDLLEMSRRPPAGLDRVAFEVW